MASQQSGFGAFTDGLLAGRLLGDIVEKTHKEALSLAHLTAEQRAELKRNEALTVARVLSEDAKYAKEQKAQRAALKAKQVSQRAAELADKWDRDPQFRTVSTIVVTVMLAAFYPAGIVVAAIFAYHFAMLFAAAFSSDARFEHRKARIRACARRIFSFGCARRLGTS